MKRLMAEAGDAGRTVQRLLHERLPASNAEAKGLIAAGCVRLNGRPVEKPDVRVRGGDTLEIVHDPERRYASAAKVLRGGEGWRVVHEDDDVVVVDKDAGLLTVPTSAPSNDSLEEMLLAAYRKRGHKKPALHVVHRIDRFTSGLVVFARHHTAAQELKRQFLERTPQRVYTAVAEGHLDPERGRLAHHLAEHPKSLKVYVALPGSAGRAASLRYRVVERMPHADLLEVTLETGRRNQIRVQLAAAGHPIVGDLAYGRPSPWIGRAALHARRLAFDAPRGRKRLAFEAPLPADMRRLVAKLGAGAEPSLREEHEHPGVGEQVVRPAQRRDLRVAEEPQKRHARKVPRQRR